MPLPSLAMTSGEPHSHFGSNASIIGPLDQFLVLTFLLLSPVAMKSSTRHAGRAVKESTPATSSTEPSDFCLGTVDLHRPSSAARINAAPAPSGYSFESPSQTRLRIVAPLTQLSEDTRPLDLAAKRLYSPLDTVAFLDRDLTHTARLYASNRRLLNPKKKTGRRARSYLPVLPAPLSGAWRP